MYFLDTGSQDTYREKNHMIFWLNRVFHWVRMAFQTVQNARNRWVPELKKLSDNVEKLEASLTGTDECVVDIYELEEKHDDRITTLEEEVTALKAENVEMRNHFNSMIKQLNDITAFVNEKHVQKGYSLRSYKT